MHAELKHYLDQPQDKDRQEGEDLPGTCHGNGLVADNGREMVLLRLLCLHLLCYGPR